MNFLAHLFLSCNDEDLLIGNMMGDFIKNREIPGYPESVQRGIRLHRSIDSYTDQHPQVRKGTQRLQPNFRKYAPVVIDIYYDYILANSWQRYSATAFDNFRQEVYAILEKRMAELPVKLRKRLPAMIQGDWLKSYQTASGLNFAFRKLGERAQFPVDFSKATQILMDHLPSFEAEFHAFFPQAIAFVDEQCSC